MKTTIVIIASLALCACDLPPPPPPSVDTSKTVTVKLPNGMTATRYLIDNPAIPNHYVYVVEGRTAVTENHQDGGKHKKDHVITTVLEQ